MKMQAVKKIQSMLQNISIQIVINNYSNDIDYSYMRWTLQMIFKHIYESKEPAFCWKELLSYTIDEKKYFIDSNQTIRYAMKKLEEISNDDRESLYITKGNELFQQAI